MKEQGRSHDNGYESNENQFEPNALDCVHEEVKSGNEWVITENGRLILKIDPFVEDPTKVLKFLRGNVLRYDDPLEPVGLEDWEAVK